MCTYITLDRRGGRWLLPGHCSHLYVSQVKFGAAGARQLGGVLLDNPTVTEVDSSSCDIRGRSGASALGQGLRGNTALRRWDLGNNQLGDTGAAALAGGLAANSGLRVLNLAHNRIGPAGAAALARALRNNTALTSLSLDSNRLHDEGAFALAELLRENGSLERLVLSGNHIGNRGAQALAAALAANTRLTSLHLKYNFISGEGARLLAEAVLAGGQRLTITGPEFLTHTVLRGGLKRAALASGNTTQMFGVAAMYEAGRLSSHKVKDRFSQAYCWCATQPHPLAVSHPSLPTAGTRWLMTRRPRRR